MASRKKYTFNLSTAGFLSGKTGSIIHGRGIEVDIQREQSDELSTIYILRQRHTPVPTAMMKPTIWRSSLSPHRGALSCWLLLFLLVSQHPLEAHRRIVILAAGAKPLLEEHLVRSARVGRVGGLATGIWMARCRGVR